MTVESFLKFAERLGLGIAAAGGLVVTACISGLPSASCAAMAATYERAIGMFGLTALLALSANLIASLWSTTLLSASLSSIFPLVGRAAIAIPVGIPLVAAVTFLYLGAVAGTHNLQISVKHCLVGTDAEIASRVHTPITLLGPFDWDLWFSRIHWWD